MRITGGAYGGRKLLSPKGDHIRPATDKVRQALFNILLKYNYPDEATVLDLFCGTGSLGLESLSRGARTCVFVDKSKESLDLCRKNVEMLKIKSETVGFLQKNAMSLSSKDIKQQVFDLVFLDPPYRQGFVGKTLQNIADSGVMAAQALCICECEKEWNEDVPDAYTVLERRTYGDVRLLFCRFAV